MEIQRFRVTEYLAPIVLVLVVAIGFAWLAVRLGREASNAAPEPRPAATDYRLAPVR